VKTESTDQPQEMDKAGVIVAVIMIVVASVAIWDTTSMLDSDSYVFPRAVAIAMISLSILLIGRQIIKPSVGVNDEAGTVGGSYVRRVWLVVAMIASALLMPILGFLIAGVLVFIAIMMLAMYDEWTPKLRMVFPLVGVGIVAGFYFMFAKLLLVPLPLGVMFE
jgi:putative tricarboxylic transport membrane protein